MQAHRHENQTNDNGKKTDVSVAPDGNQLRLTVNGLNRGIKPRVDQQLLEAGRREVFNNKQVPILEVDSGEGISLRTQIPGNAAAQGRQSDSRLLPLPRVVGAGASRSLVRSLPPPRASRIHGGPVTRLLCN